MSVFTEALTAVPVSLALALIALRFGPSALITLLAGTVAVLTRDSRRGGRALRVLQLFRQPSAGIDRPDRAGRPHPSRR